VDVDLADIHEEILKILSTREASYARPTTSEEIGAALNVSPSYVRERMSALRKRNLVGVRRGRGGGYYVREGSRIGVRP